MFKLMVLVLGMFFLIIVFSLICFFAWALVEELLFGRTNHDASK